MHLTCRRLYNAAHQQFAVVNFTERVHVVTPHSIDALINITKHPAFGKYVKAIGICSARRSISVKGPPRRSVALNGYVTTKCFARAMEQVFKNIKDRSGSVSITIYDNPGMGNLGNWSGHRLSTRPTPIKCHGWADLLKLSSSWITYRTAETFEQTVYAARRVKCRITCLKMDLFTGYNSLAQAQIQQAMEEILESTLTPLSVDLGRSGFPKLSYDNRAQSIDLRDIVYSDTIMNAGFNIPVDTLYAWASTQKVTQVKVDLIDNYMPACLQAILTPQLERLDLSRMYAQTGHLSHNLWSQTIAIISTLPRLQHCRLSDFTYCIDLTWGDSHLLYFILPGHGRIPCKVGAFKLLFPDGSGTIQLDGDGIRETLHDLVHYVRAAEERKIQQIISDGFIEDDIIRGIHEV